MQAEIKHEELEIHGRIFLLQLTVYVLKYFLIIIGI